MGKKVLATDYILGKCSKCQFLRLIKSDQFVCSLCASGLKKGSSSLLKLSQTHRGLIIPKPKCSGRGGMVTLIAVINQLAQKTEAASRGQIGFSTGCLYYCNLSLVDKLKVFLRAGATVVELSFGTPKQLFEFSLDEAIKSKLRKFSRITVHAPFKEIRYFDGAGNTDEVIIKLKELFDNLPISGFVFHPDTIANFIGLEVIGLPVLIENMDRNKKIGISAEDIAAIKDDYNFGFVLDLQHAFEHDPSMDLANEMLQIMGERLSHLHVSGEFGDHHHIPLHLAQNQEAIGRILKLMPSVPVILEGVFMGLEPLASAKRELAYLAS